MLSTRRLPFKIVTISATESSEAVRGGILPFRETKNGNVEFLLVRPHPLDGHPDGLPKFQLARGDRLKKPAEGDDLLEAPLETALRNGVEEAGLRIGSIQQLLDMGIYDTFGREGTYSPVHMYAARVNDSIRLASPKRPFDVKWLKLAGNEEHIRPNHLPIMRDMEDEIRWFLQQEKAHLQR